jgi:Ribbon-helix-helix protein, copG family
MHMCYSKHMATPEKSERANSRTVVLLRDSDRKKLEKLAAKEKVSSGEIIRRSLDTYKTLEARIRKEEEEKMMESTLVMLMDALEGANRSLTNTCKRLDELHLQLNPQAITE